MLSNPDMMRQMLNPDNHNAMMQMQQAMGQLQGSGLMGAASGGGGGGGGIDFSSLLGGMGGLPGVPTGVPGASGASVDPAVTYASQISQLQDMGFSDAAANGRALLRTQGNINAAVELLLSGTI
jgi:ubiquilin